MTKVWTCDGEPPLRRYNSRGPPYQVHDRYMSANHQESHRHATRGYGRPHESSHDDQESEPDSKSARRRIPVACGRCRKRKIRCTGPQGDSGCQNCKNAGSSDCQFNRVASDEVIFRDSTVDFTYNTELARSVHCRGTPQVGSYRPQSPGYAHGLPLSLYTYRLQAPSDFHYEPKSACYIPPYGGEYSEDALDYTLSGSSYPLYGQEHASLSASYGLQSGPRPWNPATPSAKGHLNGMYFENEGTPYAQSPAQYSSTPYGLHPSVSAESNNFSFSGMASSLPIPVPITSNDRSLPPPSGLRPNSGLTPLRSADAVPYAGHSPKSSFSHNIPGSQLIPASHPSPVTYLPLSGSPSADPYTSGILNSNPEQQHQDTYSTNDSWPPSTLKVGTTLRSHQPSPDLFYGQGRNSTRKASQSGQSSVSGSSSAQTTGQSYHSSYQQDAAQLGRNGSVDMSRVARDRRSSSSRRGA